MVLAIAFLIILTISSTGLYTSVRHLARETAIEEVLRIRGYYASIAALRYAAILLEDPAGNCGFSATAKTFHTGTYLASFPDHARTLAWIAFCNDIGINTDDLILFIKELADGGPYRVQACWRWYPIDR